MKDLMTPGRAKGVKYGEKAIDYLYEIKRERRIEKPVFDRDNYNFRYGRDNEPYAISWLRTNTNLTVRDCSNDFPEKIFVIHPDLPFSGDSPDGYINGTDLLEVKSLVNEAKFERYLEMSREDLVGEYRDQFAQHFACHPNAEKLYYLIYDGTHDEDEFDERDPNEPSRGKYFIYRRKELEERIAEIEARQREAFSFLLISEETGIPLFKINEYLRQEGEASCH